MNIDYLEQANQQFNQKNYQAALENYNLAIKHYPALPEAYYNRGLVKRIINEHQEAIQDFSIATILNPKMFLAYYYRGLTYYELGDYAYATANYSHAIFLNPKLARAYYQRAIIHGELGKVTHAYEDFKRAAIFAKEQKDIVLLKKAKKAQSEVKKSSQSSPVVKGFLISLKLVLLSLLLITITEKFNNNLNQIDQGKSQENSSSINSNE